MSPQIRLLASFIALMMAMGIGRFALTPQMPHLLSEGQVDLAFTEQMRHLRSQGEAANAHGHHQGDGAGE